MRTPFVLIVVPSLVAAVLTSGPAHAADPTVSECLSASNLSLKLRSEHKLRQVRAQLLTCASASCPPDIREECSQRMDRLTASIPTVVFAVTDGAGRELSAVKVTMDGEVVADHLDGSALTLDPGSHQFTFETAAQPPFTETLILHEGEQNRRESVTLERLSPAPAPTPPARPTPPPASAPGVSADATMPSRLEQSGHGRRVLGLVVGSAGLAGVAAGGIFGALTFSTWSKANDECPSHLGCSTSATNDRSSAVTFGTVSTVAFIAGGALLAGGITLYFTAPKDHAPNVALGADTTPVGLSVIEKF